jgi:methionine-rich copper-binding protein CopC
MTAARRLLASGLATVLALALTAAPAHAATRRVTPTAKPTPAAQVKKAPAVLPPQIYQLNPLKINPTVQPNIMILGQYMTPATTAHVGGRPATTVQVPDTNHLLVKLPENLSQGTYLVEVTNEAGTVTASDALVVESPGPTNMMYLMGGGFLILLVLVMRLARTPSFA